MTKRRVNILVHTYIHVTLNKTPRNHLTCHSDQDQPRDGSEFTKVVPGTVTVGHSCTTRYSTHAPEKNCKNFFANVPGTPG